MKKYWNMPEEECAKINNAICRLKFKPEGVIQHRFQKLLLMTMLVDLWDEFKDRDLNKSRINPIWNEINYSVIYKYQELADVCGFKTIKTFKKYLYILADDGFIELWTFKDKSIFEVKININKILLAPKFDEIE